MTYNNQSHQSAADRLRSTTRGDLVVCSTATHFGARAFAVSGPKAWNQLPAHLQALETVGSFKTALKTYLHSTLWLLQIVWTRCALVMTFMLRRVINCRRYYYYYYKDPQFSAENQMKHPRKMNEHKNKNRSISDRQSESTAQIHVLHRRGTASTIVDTSSSTHRLRYSSWPVFSTLPSTCFRLSRSTYITNLLTTQHHTRSMQVAGLLQVLNTADNHLSAGPAPAVFRRTQIFMPRKFAVCRGICC